jgi:general nucleoside transport system permease protein
VRIELIRRPERSGTLAVLSPLLAVALTVVSGFVMFTLLGVDPLHALYSYFIAPLTDEGSLEDLTVRAAPLILIGVGLTFCYRANVWNIGAEGQLCIGAITGSAIPILLPAWQSPLVLPLMLLMGILGGMAYAAVPALLKTRFGASEILTSLMLVYVGQLVLDWVARGPWRNPAGRNFPNSRHFDDGQVLPVIFGNEVRLNLLLAVLAVIVAAFVLRWTLTGFQIAVVGQAPRAGAFAGFSHKRLVLLTFLISGGLAGLAGICEVAGPLDQLRTVVSPPAAPYGFTAIIVAFLGRLNPVGVLVAGLLLALTYLGGLEIQISLHLSDQTAQVFQGLLMFFVLACDTFILYRIRIVRAAPMPIPPLEEASRARA